MSSSARKGILSRKHVVRGGSAVVAASQIIALSCFSHAAQAQNTPLLNPDLYDQYSPLEKEFATALDDLAASRSTFFCTEGCNSSSQKLQDTAYTLDSLTSEAGAHSQGGEGPMDILTDEQFDSALRWLAPEELFALAPIATGFGNGQLGLLDNHIDNTRSLSRSRLFANNVVSPELKRGYASTAGAQSSGAAFSRFNMFFDVSDGFGKRDDTTGTGSEDAFDFNSGEVGLGGDWRFSDNLVSGAMLGYSKRKVDFDVSKSRADGKIDLDGFSLLAFAQWDSLHWYGNVSVGYQKSSYDFFRRIAVSEESEFPDNYYAPDAGAKGSPDGSGLLANFTVGFPFQADGWETDLYLKGAWQKQSIDAFSEELASVVDPGSTYSAGFGFDVSKQNIKSFDTAAGFKVNYVLTPSFGVVIPYLRAEFHRQLEDSPQKVGLTFQGLDDLDTTGLSASDIAALRDSFQFDLTSERPDKYWVTTALGVSAVLRGSTRVSDAGRGAGGLQCYLQLSTVFGLAHYDNSAIMAGLRYEF